MISDEELEVVWSPIEEDDIPNAAGWGRAGAKKLAIEVLLRDDCVKITLSSNGNWGVWPC